MKAVDVKALIGKPVQWLENTDHHRGQGFQHRGTVLAVKGKNVQVDMQGCTDWKWLLDMVDLQEEKS